MYGPMPHGMMLAARAVSYAGSKLNRVPVQSNGLVVMKPLAAEATMKPLRPVVRSLTWASKAWPPLTAASNIRTFSRSPGFMSNVCEFGVNVAFVLRCGLGGPVGTPSVWIQPKLTGSKQLLLHGPEPLPVHSRLSIVRAAHQCVLSQLRLSTNGANPGA